MLRHHPPMQPLINLLLKDMYLLCPCLEVFQTGYNVSHYNNLIDLFFMFLWQTVPPVDYKLVIAPRPVEFQQLHSLEG